MTEQKPKNFRKLARDFKGRVELMNKTPLKDLESMFLELYEFGVNEYIRTEKEQNPNKSRKEIIINMYKFHEKMMKRRKK